MELPINKIIQGDALEELKKLPDNSVDVIITDPPYFLINNSGSGFMGKEWESLKGDKLYNIVWKSEEFVKNVIRFFIQIKVESNGIEENIAQKNVNINQENQTKTNTNVKFVEKDSQDIYLKSKVNINSVQGIALTKQEVLDMLKEMSINHIDVIENLKDNVLFVIPYSFIQKLPKNIVQENVLKNLIKSECVERTIHLTSMEEARIKGVIGGMIGNKLESKSMKEINGNVEIVEKNVNERKYNVIILNHIERIKIIKWITLLLFVLNATIKLKENLSLILMYEFHYLWSKEALRILKPGGYLLSFGGTRTYHRMTCGIEDAGFEIRDCILWIYSTGFPKSLNIGKQIAKQMGEDVKIGTAFKTAGEYGGRNLKDPTPINQREQFKHKPTTPEAKEWEGWGTALKPSVEPIVVARKPLSEKNVALNVLKWGTGGINIDESRIEIGDDIKRGGFGNAPIGYDGSSGKGVHWQENTQGRFPANIILDEESAKILDEQVGEVSQGGKRNKPVYFKANKFFGGTKTMRGYSNAMQDYPDRRGASRFFYVAKASKSERNDGMDDMQEIRYEDKRGGSMDANTTETMQLGGASLKGEPKQIQLTKNNHPTVKPIKLMEYLIKLVSREGAIILDPFIGSGTTAIACLKLNRKFIGIEKEKEYCDIAEARIKPFLEQQRLI